MDEKTKLDEIRKVFLRFKETITARAVIPGGKEVSIFEPGDVLPGFQGVLIALKALGYNTEDVLMIARDVVGEDIAQDVFHDVGDV